MDRHSIPPFWVLSIPLSTFGLLPCVSVESGARTWPILYLALFPTPRQAPSGVAQQCLSNE